MNKNQSFYQRCLDGGELCRLLAAWSPTHAEIKHAEETYQILADEYLLWEYASGRKTFIEGKFNGEWATSPGKDSAIFAKHLLGLNERTDQNRFGILSEILKIRSYVDDWDSYGAKAVSDSALLDAVYWITINKCPITKAPHVVAVPWYEHPSGVCLEWSSPSGELLIDFYGGGEMGFLIFTPHGEEEGEIPISDWNKLVSKHSIAQIIAPDLHSPAGEAQHAMG